MFKLEKVVDEHQESRHSSFKPFQKSWEGLNLGGLSQIAFISYNQNRKITPQMLQSNVFFFCFFNQNW